MHAARHKPFSYYEHRPNALTRTTNKKSKVILFSLEANRKHGMHFVCNIIFGYYMSDWLVKLSILYFHKIILKNKITHAAPSTVYLNCSERRQLNIRCNPSDEIKFHSSDTRSCDLVRACAIAWCGTLRIDSHPKNDASKFWSRWFRFHSSIKSIGHAALMTCASTRTILFNK